MDLSTLAVNTENEGVEVELVDYNNASTGIYIKVISSESEAYQEFIRKWQNRRLQGRRSAMPSVEEIDAVYLDALCKIAIKGWRTGNDPAITFSGKKYEFTPENAKLIFGNRGFRELRKQVQEFMEDQKNFLSRPVKG